MDEMIPSAAIGAVAGLRTFTSPAAISRAAVTGLLGLNGGPLRFFGSPLASKVLTGLAVAELVGDKLPVTPSRLEPASLGARFVSGALCGAAMSAGRKKSLIPGAIFGGIGAVAAAYLGYHIRQTLVNRYDLPDTAVALAEDAVALGGAMAITALWKPAIS